MANRTVKYLIVGAGPAGLSTAREFVKLGHSDFLIIDSGKNVYDRDHSNPVDIAEGAGGAGCFSDGKFSFFPAGTNVWKLSPKILQHAYSSLLQDIPSELHVASMPAIDEIRNYFFEMASHQWKLKKYPTAFITLEQRKAMIASYVNSVPSSNIMFNTTMVDYSNDVDDYINDIITYKVKLVNGGNVININAQNVIFAGGRFLPCQNMFRGLCTKFRRYEFGFRIETSKENTVMQGYSNLVDDFTQVLDPKFRYMHNANIEFRTFCWCREGETVISKSCGMECYSGRSDCAVSDKSNFGFLVRITSSDVVTEDIFSKIKTMPVFEISCDNLPKAESDNLPNTLLSELQTRYSDTVGEYLYMALKALQLDFPALFTSETVLKGPSIEGVGWYPNHDHNLKIDKNMYAIGDTTGTFRGIIPCMISGYWLANMLENPSLRFNVTFISGNKDKIRETEQILGPVKTNILTLDEYQGKPQDIVQEKCLAAYKANNGLTKVKQPVLVEDTSLHFMALNGMPGPYIKDFVESMGVDIIVQMLSAFDDKTAWVRCIYAYLDDENNDVKIFNGIVWGYIVPKRGSHGFGWDSIFAPWPVQPKEFNTGELYDQFWRKYVWKKDVYVHGFDDIDCIQYIKNISEKNPPADQLLTFAEMSDGAKNKSSHRYLALKKMYEHFY